MRLTVLLLELNVLLVAQYLSFCLLFSQINNCFRVNVDIFYAVLKDVICRYHVIFNKCAEEMLNKWSKASQGKRIEIFDDVTLMTLDSLLQCIMSCETHCQSKK